MDHFPGDDVAVHGVAGQNASRKGAEDRVPKGIPGEVSGKGFERDEGLEQTDEQDDPGHDGQGFQQALDGLQGHGPGGFLLLFHDSLLLKMGICLL